MDQRVPLPPPPRWLVLFAGPDRFPLGALTRTFLPISSGMIMGLVLPGATGYIVMLACFVLIAWQFLGKMLLRRFVRRYAASDEARAHFEAARAAAEQEAAINHQAVDWLTRVTNGSDSPFRDMGFDSTVGMLIVVRRDQRVPDHPDRWIAQTFFNTLPPDQDLTFDMASAITHQLAHVLLDTHRQTTAGTVEVRT